MHEMGETPAKIGIPESILEPLVADQQELKCDVYRWIDKDKLPKNVMIADLRNIFLENHIIEDFEW